ncbi:MAG: DUF3375 domain-containing protein [Gammaproteobacteria bacterium]
MDHDHLEQLRRGHPALKLLRSDNLALIVSFLHHVFVEPNERALQFADVASRLDDYLFALRELHGDEVYPRTGRDYLDDWCAGSMPFLRKYYTTLGDEPRIDLTPDTEKAIGWLQELEQREFVGTESRLLTMFELLRTLAHETEQDAGLRIAELERRRDEIDAEIGRLNAGDFQMLDATRIKERYLQATDTARRLLGDFREVEHNFRALDRETRERIATSDFAKGAVLDDVFREHDVIWDSDQGRSFRAFWEFLMSPHRQAELESLLEAVHRLDDVLALNPPPLLRHIKYALMDAGEQVYKTNTQLAEQLRRFLDDQAFLENRRIMSLIRSIERRTVALKEAPPPEREFVELDGLKPDIDLVMSRGLFSPPAIVAFDDRPPDEGEADLDLNLLYQQSYVDPAELEANVRRALQSRDQITLYELVRDYPLSKGVAEAVAYLRMASERSDAMVDESCEETLAFEAPDGRWRTVRMPRILFVRSSGGSSAAAVPTSLAGLP